MIPLSTIEFDVVEARQNSQTTVCGKSFVLIHLSRQIELDEPQEVVSCSDHTQTSLKPRSLVCIPPFLESV
jgi:hypothetical protein